VDQLSRLDAKIARAAERAAAEKPPTPDFAAFMVGDHQPDGAVVATMEPKPAEKPTLGVRPWRLWVKDRLHDLYSAMSLRKSAGQQAPAEWADEANHHERIIALGNTLFGAHPDPEPEPAVNSLTMAEALAVVRNKLLADRALAYSWHCAIAGLVRDALNQQHGTVLSALTADAAERIMGSLFDVHGAGAVAHMPAEESCERAPEHDQNARMAQMASIIGNPQFAAEAKRPVLPRAWSAIGDDDTRPSETEPLPSTFGGPEPLPDPHA
jgi:hypothetical protein